MNDKDTLYQLKRDQFMLAVAKHELTKHLKGKHDQKEHGNWAREQLARLEPGWGISRSKREEIISQIEGKDLKETHDNAARWLQDRLKAGGKIEWGMLLNEDGKVEDIRMGLEDVVRRKRRRGQKHWGLHSHPATANVHSDEDIDIALNPDMVSETIVTEDSAFILQVDNDEIEDKEEFKRRFRSELDMAIIASALHHDRISFEEIEERQARGEDRMRVHAEDAEVGLMLVAHKMPEVEFTGFKP